MKYIHIVLGKANPNRQNGVNVVVHNLALSAWRQGFDVQVWGLTGNVHNNDLIREYQLRLFETKMIHFAVDSKLKRALNELQSSDLVHFHGVHVPEFFTIAKILRRRNIRWIVTMHSAYDLRNLAKKYLLKWLYFMLFDRSLLRDARALHIYSKGEAEVIRRFVILPRLILLPNGCEVLPKVSSGPTNDTRGHPIFGYIGRLTIQQKGLDILLNGFSEYKNKHGRGELWIVGAGDDHTCLEAMAQRLDIGASTRFFGPLFGNDKMMRLAEMDVFVYPSRWEGMPMAVLEAVAAGKPTIISQETNLGEYVNNWNAGFVLEDNRPSNLCAAMQLAESHFRSGKLKEVGVKARHMAQTEFSWDRIFRSLLEAIDSGRSNENAT